MGPLYLVIDQSLATLWVGGGSQPGLPLEVTLVTSATRAFSGDVSSLYSPHGVSTVLRTVLAQHKVNLVRPLSFNCTCPSNFY